MKKKNIILNFMFLLLPLIIVTSGYCSDQARIDPDYSKPNTWLALPSSTDKPVDVFGFTQLLTQGTYVVNPLNWTVNSGKVSAALNKGSVFINNNLEPKLIPNFCSAEIKDGGLVVELKE